MEACLCLCQAGHQTGHFFDNYILVYLATYAWNHVTCGTLCFINMCSNTRGIITFIANNYKRKTFRKFYYSRFKVLMYKLEDTKMWFWIWSNALMLFNVLLSNYSLQECLDRKALDNIDYIRLCCKYVYTF